MKRTFTASLLAATLALGSLSAAPVYASSSSDKALKTAVGALVLFGLANELSRNDKSSSVTRHATPVYSNSDDRQRAWPPQPGYKKNRRHSVIPLQCLRSVSARHNKRRHVVTQRCLHREGFNRNLPNACQTSYSTPKGRRSGYSANCLTNKGYLIGRPRN